jgi:hypothetical protein
LPEARSTLTPTGWLLAAALLAALVTPPPTAADAAGADRQAPPTRLKLTVGGHRSVTLRCDPPGGTHPDPQAACHAIAAAGGDLAMLRRNPEVACITVYDPVTVRARGTWRGNRVAYDATYSNRCALTAATGPVFDF